MIIDFPIMQLLSNAWLKIGGKPEIDIAALEPTLWRDGDKNICDLVYMLTSLGYKVNMTTNGSMLERYCQQLKHSGIQKLRISWHTLDKNIFQAITVMDDYDIFYRGILAAIDAGMDVCFNRILLKGYLDDLKDQVNFVDRYKLRMKFYDLYWTESIADIYHQFYITPQEALKTVEDECRLSPLENLASGKRERLRYIGPMGGIIEYKISESAQKSLPICRSCRLKNDCIEGFGEYVRVYPSIKAGLCYLRTELDTSIIEKGEVSFSRLEQLCEESGLSFQKLKTTTPLRLVLTSFCNFNCGFPYTDKSFCLKSMRKGFQYPARIIERISPKEI